MEQRSPSLHDAVGPLAPGISAPPFRLPWTHSQTIALEQYRGQVVVLLFHPAVWQPVSAERLTLYQSQLPLLEAYGAVVLAIAVDTLWSQLAFARAHGITFPLLADFEPKGRVARSYGVYLELTGSSARALFIVDAAGIIRWSDWVPELVNPGLSGILRAGSFDHNAGEGRLAPRQTIYDF